MAAAESLPIPKLVDLLLEEQQSLTAVERFSEQHDAGAVPLQRRYYEDLIPAAAPAPGQQYAFRVDLDSCTGCKACVTACHNLNGLGEAETWRSVGALIGGSDIRPQQQTVTTACHHCEDPACLNGCPVNAYEKDPVTGIVRHLDDQCIGCQYCTLQCPYDVPQYDASLGIVRKCDMCSDRLAVGEAPACVQGCPNEAISIDIVDTGSGPSRLLPVDTVTIPSSEWTQPTTRYVTTRTGLDSLRPADAHEARPADPHHPLSMMLVLSQLGVGVTCVEAALAAIGQPLAPPRVAIAGIATLLGLGVANLHLGRPQYAYRVVLGVFRSWMSREILVLGAFAGLLGAVAALTFVPGLVEGASFGLLGPALQPWLAGAAAAVGLAAVFSSVMIYADTPRRVWRLNRTAPLFFGTTALLGLAGACVGALWASPADAGLATALAFLWTLGGSLKTSIETSQSQVAADDPDRELLLARERLLAGTLQPIAQARRWLGIAGSVVLPALIAVGLLIGGAGVLWSGVAVLALSMSLAGEWFERQLFFRAAVAPRMPGG